MVLGIFNYTGKPIHLRNISIKYCVESCPVKQAETCAGSGKIQLAFLSFML